MENAMLLCWKCNVLLIEPQLIILMVNEFISCLENCEKCWSLLKASNVLMSCPEYLKKVNILKYIWDIEIREPPTPPTPLFF